MPAQNICSGQAFIKKSIHKGDFEREERNFVGHGRFILMWPDFGASCSE